MRYIKMLPAALIGSLLAVTVAVPAYSGTKSYPVEGSATTEPLACRAANRIAKIGIAEKDNVSISPCRCIQDGVYHYVCTVDLTYRTKD